MRHAAITLNEQAEQCRAKNGPWDLLFCSDMLNLAEFLGLASTDIRELPSIAYFHENQITYPVQHEKEYDYHFALSNMTTALAATRVWFNSSFHLESFLTGSKDFLIRMPDFQPVTQVLAVRQKADIRPPGIDDPPARGVRQPGPIRILWAARWEHDKRPDIFFAALKELVTANIDFEVSIIGGGNSRQILPVFDEARTWLGDRIIHWGYQELEEDYESILMNSDVVVSTADHEFFGIGIVRAVAAGVYPVVPDKLAYPEVLAECDPRQREAFFYDGSAEELVIKLRDLSERLSANALWAGDSEAGTRAVQKYSWCNLVPGWDTELESCKLNSKV